MHNRLVKNTLIHEISMIRDGHVGLVWKKETNKRVQTIVCISQLDN